MIQIEFNLMYVCARQRSRNRTQTYRALFSCVACGGRAAGYAGSGKRRRFVLIHGEFFLRTFQAKFGPVKFDQVFLDYFWMPDSIVWLNRSYMVSFDRLLVLHIARRPAGEEISRNCRRLFLIHYQEEGVL